MTEKPNGIAHLNDQLRRTGLGGKVLITTGIQSLSQTMQSRSLHAISTYDGFSEGNDPYGERDFGSVDLDGERYFWKIDYYDRAYECGSPDPADSQVTRRVMTVMRADEY